MHTCGCGFSMTLTPTWSELICVNPPSILVHVFGPFHSMAFCPPRKHPSPCLQRRPPPEYWPAGSFLDFLFRPQSSGSGWGLAIGLARGCRPGLPGSTICMGPGARQVASRPRECWPGPWRKAAPPRVWCLSDLHLGDRPPNPPPNPSPFLGIGQVGGDETCDTTHTHAMGVLPT